MKDIYSAVEEIKNIIEEVPYNQRIYLLKELVPELTNILVDKKNIECEKILYGNLEYNHRDYKGIEAILNKG